MVERKGLWSESRPGAVDVHRGSQLVQVVASRECGVPGALASIAVGLLMQMVTPWCPNKERSFFLGCDGNAMTFERDQHFNFVAASTCPHFEQQKLGDPFWSSRKA